MRRPCLLLLLALCGALAFASAADARTLRAPASVSPANGARVQQLPAINWNAVPGAASYEYEIAADSHFDSIVLGKGSGKGVSKTYNLSAAVDKTVPNGTYYWRVRGVTAKDKVGRWSRSRRIVKAWTTAPQITGGNGVAVSWPTSALVLRWSSVPYANKYIVSVATDPALSNLVIGTRTKPFETQGTTFAMPISLAPGVYYWAITPVDAEGHRGARSALATFQWTWPTTTATSVADLQPEAGAFDDPIFSWGPIPGAARYEVEVNSAEGFPAGSKWCCTGTTTGTSLAPLQSLANNRYYWRVRGIDARGDAGVWNEGQSFTKAFDATQPSVRGLTVRDIEGSAVAAGSATSTPIVTWEPVPGASRYEVQLGVYNSGGHYCDWTLASSPGYHADTATTAWTPLGAWGGKRPYSEAWPAPQFEREVPTGGATYCVRVDAHSDDDAKHGEVISEWTYLNGYNNSAFAFSPPPKGSGCSGTPESAYVLPGNGSATAGTPYFTWHPVAGAGGYYVVIARDAGFTQVVDVGFTHVNAYAPRLAKATPLSDETTAYYWAVMPSETETGTGVCSDPLHDSPRNFNKSSSPPQPLAPSPGSEVTTQPSFRWTPAENARTYHLQVAQDPTFGAPIDDVTTDATAYTSSSTYPADTVLYWRVRANDWIGQGLNWSPTQTFVRRLPVPSLDPLGPTTVLGIPPITWSSVQGAIAYNVHIEQPTGKSTDSVIESPSATVSTYYGTGIAHYQVRAEFPTSVGGKVAGPYSPRQSSLLILAAPRGVRGTRSGSRLLLTWNPEPDAKQYRVQIATSSGFTRPIESHTVDGTSWAPNLDLRKKRNRGTLYWRVAPVDQRGGVGSFTAGTFGGSRSKRCVSGTARKRHVVPCKRRK
jgi:large repetitive protein